MTASPAETGPNRPEYEPATYVQTVGQMARVSADRARRFSTLELDPRWAPLVGALTLPPLWALQMFVTGVHAGQIRSLGSASVTLKTDRTTRRPWGLTIIGIAVAPIGLLIVEGAALFGSNAVSTVSWVVLLVCAAILIREGINNRRRIKGHPEAADASLQARRDDLAAGGSPSYVLIALVASRDNHHAAWNLVEALKVEWRAQQASVVLFPATTRLIDYYQRLGAALDGFAGRRMLFDYRS